MAQRHSALAAALAQVSFLNFAIYHRVCSAPTFAAIVALSIALMRSGMLEHIMDAVRCPRDNAWAGAPELLWGMLSGMCITAVRSCPG